MRRLLVLLMITCCMWNTSGLLINQNIASDDITKDIECPVDDEKCIEDRMGFEAIHFLHHQIDDDHNGNLDRSESDGFIRDELRHEDSQSRQTRFHGNDDQISVDDLWHLWVNSQVYNWTLDDTLDWLTSHVELPQYVDTFKSNAVTGHALPRIAANSQYVSNVLGLKNSVHKQKLALKAMDAVLFGAPKLHNYVKDLVLVTLLVIAVGGCWLAYMQHRYSQSQVKKLITDMKHLQDAETALGTLKQKLDSAEQEQIVMQQEKKNLELRMEKDIEEAKIEAERLRGVRDITTEEMSRLKLAEDELIQVRHALAQAEKRMENKHNTPSDLQPWLQLTYEIEKMYFNNKREIVEKSLQQAKEMCDKLKKKRTTFMGSVRIAHSTSINETDLAILNASAAAEKIRTDLKEHKERWSYIQRISDFNIELNPGKDYLELHLYGNGSGFRKPGLNSSMEETEASAGTPGSPSDMSIASSTLPTYRISAAANTPTSSHPSDLIEDNASHVTHRVVNSSSVNFNLGGDQYEQNNQYNSLCVDNDIQSRERSHSANTSMEDELGPLPTHKLPRPQTLPSDLCDGHNNTMSHHRTHPIINYTATPPHLEDLSSHESSDNLSLGSTAEPHERAKKKRRIFPKIQFTKHKNTKPGLTS